MKSEKTIMLVEVTTGTLRLIRSSGVYANLSGHKVDYICFLASQGTFVAEVKAISKNVPLGKVYRDVDSRAKRTTMYQVGTLQRHSLVRNGKLPRGRKRIADYAEFLKVRKTNELFKRRY